MRTLLAALLLATPALAVPPASTPPTGPEAVILGFRQDGLADYRIDPPLGIYLRASSDGKWYYLHVRPNCPRLAAADGFSVETGPQGRLDRYSTITVQGERCWLTSVTPSPAPLGYGDYRHRHD
jgi:hypothetical protein